MTEPKNAASPESEARCERRLGSERQRAFARSALLLLCVYALVFNLSVVRGSSMSPGIRDGDRILVEPWSYLVGTPRRGDVVVLRCPVDPRVDYIKRVVGLPGDQVVLAGGRVWVDGAPIEEPYVRESDSASFCVERVRPGHVYVLGDNRPRSSDSRDFGQVPLELVRGRVELRIWPPERAGWLQ